MFINGYMSIHRGFIIMANGFLPGRYTERDFYRQPDISDRLNKIGINAEDIQGVTVKEEGFSLFDAATLKNINLSDVNNNVLGTLFAKIYSVGKRRERVYISRFPRRLEQDVLYSFENLKFQNDLKLPVPVVIHQGVTKEISKEHSHDEYVYVLLTEYWEGPTADQDVIALRKLIDARKEKLKSDKFIDEDEKKVLAVDIDGLRDVIKKDIVSKSLDTVIEFAGCTTDIIENNNFRLPNTSIKVDIEKDPYEFYIGKRGRQFKAVLYWNLVNQGVKSKTEIIAEDGPLKSFATGKWKEFQYLLKPLVGYMFLNGRKVYSQGDQHLHHFKRHKRKSDSLMGIFDMGSVRMEDPMFGPVRVLSSHLLGLGRKEIRELYSEKLSKYLTHFNPNIAEKDIELAFELNMIPESLWSASRRTYDSLYNTQEYDSVIGSVGEKSKIYRGHTTSGEKLILPRNIELPEAIDHRLYSVPVAIASSKRTLRDIVQGLNSDISGYYDKPALKEPLRKLYAFIEKNIIETDIIN